MLSLVLLMGLLVFHPSGLRPSRKTPVFCHIPKADESKVLLMGLLVFHMNRQYRIEQELASLKAEQAELLERDYQALKVNPPDGKSRLPPSWICHFFGCFQCIVQKIPQNCAQISAPQIGILSLPMAVKKRPIMDISAERIILSYALSTTKQPL